MSQSTPRTAPEILENARRGQIYWEERAILDFTEDLLAMMKRRRLSQKELAERLQTAPAFISKLLSGNNNYTLKTMVKVARALNSRLKVQIEPLEKANWERYSVAAMEIVAATAPNIRAEENWGDFRQGFRVVNTVSSRMRKGTSAYSADPDAPVTLAA